MRLFEFYNTETEEKKIDFDLYDDLIHYMMNDSDFYRKEYYPVHAKFQSECKEDSTPSAESFKNVVTSAYSQYKDKFDLIELDEQLTGEDLTEICKILRNKEVSEYKNEDITEY